MVIASAVTVSLGQQVSMQDTTRCVTQTSAESQIYPPALFYVPIHNEKRDVHIFIKVK